MLLDLTLAAIFVSDVSHEYSAGMTYTKTEIDNLVGSKQHTIEAIGEGASLVFNGAHLSTLKGYGGIHIGLDFPNAAVAVVLDTDNVSGLSNY